MNACCANPACQSFMFYKSECTLYSVATSAGMDDILAHESRQGPWGINTGGPGYSIGFWEMSRKPRSATDYPTMQPTNEPTLKPSLSPTSEPTGDVCTLGTMTAGGIGDKSALLDRKYFKFDDQTAYDDYASAGSQYWHNGLGRTTYVSQTSLWPEGCMNACCANPACQSFMFYKSECTLYSVVTSAGMDDILGHESRQGPWGISTGGPGYSIGFWEMSRKPRSDSPLVAPTGLIGITTVSSGEYLFGSNSLLKYDNIEFGGLSDMTVIWDMKTSNGFNTPQHGQH